MVFRSSIDGATIRRNWSLNIQRYQCAESWCSGEEAQTETPYTSMLTSRTQKPCFESSTQQASSVSTEQCPTGVKNLVKTNETKTSEKFETTERTLKEVRPLEVNSLVQTPRDDQQASGNRSRDTLQRFEKLDMETLFTRVCGAATFWELISVGMRYKTIPDFDDGFGGEVEHQHAENTHFLENKQIPEFTQRFQGIR